MDVSGDCDDIMGRAETGSIKMSTISPVRIKSEENRREGRRV